MNFLLKLNFKYRARHETMQRLNKQLNRLRDEYNVYSYAECVYDRGRIAKSQKAKRK